MAEEPKPHEPAAELPPQPGEPASAAGAAIPQIPGPPPGMPAGFPFLFSPQTQAGIPPPALQLMIQSGLTGPQQNPDTIRHMTEFLAHDSDNRLKLLEQTARRNHSLKMTILIFIVVVTAALLTIPFISIFMTGNISQAVWLLASGATWVVPILLALVAGPSVKDLLSK